MRSNYRRLHLLAAMAELSLYLMVGAATPAQAMHIMEGFLPVGWAVFWWVVAIPFFGLGVRSLTRITRENPEMKLLLALAGAFSFVLSALKIPSVTGSSSHPTGTGLGAILFGPAAMTVLGSLVLVFQAVLLANGGLTTLGANMFSMAIAEPWGAYGIYRFNDAERLPKGWHLSRRSTWQFGDLCGDVYSTSSGFSSRKRRHCDLFLQICEHFCADSGAVGH